VIFTSNFPRCFGWAERGNLTDIYLVLVLEVE
jgi:hypothetical protein